MAKVLAVLASLLFISITVLCVPAIDRNDPSLEIIKNEDAEEGYDDYRFKERVQNEINPDVKYDDKTELPPPVEEVELELPSEQQGNENSINPDTETDEYLPEEDLDGTFFEDNVEEERNDVSVNINDMEQTEEIEPENEQHTVTDNEVPEYIEQTENENTEENEEENEVEEEIEENDTWEDEENVDNEEEEEHHEESFEVETFLEEEEEELQETGMEPTDAETDGFDPWYEENLSEEEEEEEEEEDEEDFTNIRGQSLILTAMAELTKYDDDDSLGNTDIVEDDYQELVEPPEELNVVQTSPAEATDDTGNMQENSICSLPAESGKCKAYFPRYFYNSNSGECELFIYGGCDGNKNNFDTLHACESTCVRHDGL